MNEPPLQASPSRNTLQPRNTLNTVQRAVTSVAAEQLALVTVGDLRYLHISTDVASRRVKSGEWEREGLGVYRIASSSRTATVEQRMLAANLALPGSVISGWFSARIHGLPVLADLDDLAVSLVVPTGSRSRNLSVRRCRGPLPSQPWNTGRVATAVLTVVTSPRQKRCHGDVWKLFSTRRSLDAW
jgi:hypothetical protein